MATSMFPPRRGAAAEEALEQSRPADVEAETAEDVLEVDAAEQVLGREARHAGKAAGVMLRALPGIAQDGIGPWAERQNMAGPAVRWSGHKPAIGFTFWRRSLHAPGRRRPRGRWW
jgi:hypothetical protein